MFIIQTIQHLNIPPELIVMVLAMMPISEVRGALPIAIGVYKMSFLKAAYLAIIGNMIPVVIILFVFEKIRQASKRNGWVLHRVMDWFYERTKKKHSKRYDMLGVLFLMSFVALPLPFTGAWTGSLASIVFDIPFKKSFISILIGVLIATGIVYALTMGFLSII